MGIYKGITPNYNEWGIISLRPIICVLVHPQEGSWECKYLVVENFVQYFTRCADRDHLVGNILKLIIFQITVIWCVILKRACFDWYGSTFQMMFQNCYVSW